MTEREKLLAMLTPPFHRNCFLVKDSRGREVLHTGLLGRRHAIDDEVIAQMVVDALNAFFASPAEPAAGECEESETGRE